MNVTDAFQLLGQLKASPRLQRHAELVLEAARFLLKELDALDVEIDADFVEAGVVLHDVGKVLHPIELDQKGSAHESAGEKLLLDHAVPPKLARVCRSHADWDHDSNSLEELVIALADKLWKGVRVPKLETRILDRVASLSRRDRWEIFVPLDSCFELITESAPERLRRSAGS